MVSFFKKREEKNQVLKLEVVMRDAIDILLPKLAKVVHNLATFADKYKDVPTLGFTHMQPGTSFGKLFHTPFRMGVLRGSRSPIGPVSEHSLL